ncbi:hypothetical protein [Asticcacaulis biprosthecium]|nr:hypothetical protein [Asticcacaulis biprosthecium]
MQSRATLWLIVRGVALIVTGFVAAAGMTFICVLRNRFLWRVDDSMQFGPGVPDAVYVAPFIVMIAWLVIACLFAWRNRAPVGLALSAIAFAVFVINASNVFRLAYPVCNAF